MNDWGIAQFPAEWDPVTAGSRFFLASTHRRSMFGRAAHILALRCSLLTSMSRSRAIWPALLGLHHVCGGELPEPDHSVRGLYTGLFQSRVTISPLRAREQYLTHINAQ